ncbi:tRNA lysidine(34) synthetase TilS [Curvibacter sp. APW13]|uniref:tRNA lysidine(34) synthetase TilS n=1 Tax=Curvibacter sp. APW13 TaxID=3077236 RepID=UPI0028DF2E96|nr:tRNA lysidine(34) synthetase TilS [Curvibacter sp. APW13]MDT8991428.1 tRNA lysidine(34) synthetase TilS [Curvibacter sp. APW13]
MTQPFEAAIAEFAPPLPLTVALSGGADSTALLLGCARRWPGQVHAVHVNHGLQASASRFEAHCVALCNGLGVPLRVLAVHAHAASGESPEDAARRARYGAIEALAQENTAHDAFKTIAFAHNADDQTETFLLALSRGSGVPGLSGMPAQWQRGVLRCYRPLLSVAANDIRAWLRDQGQGWVEDPSNADQRFTRNRIRHSVLPALRQAFPHVDDAVARSARHLAQAQRLLEAMAQEDLERLLGGQALADALPLAGLRELDGERQANLLRYWLKSRFGAAPSTAQLAELQRQLLRCSTRGHRIHLRVAHGFALRQGPCLTWQPD